jgi:hypothetical protein
VLPVPWRGGGAGRAEAAGVPDMPGGVRARGEMQRVSGMPALVPSRLHWDVDEERQGHLPVVQSYYRAGIETAVGCRRHGLTVCR